MIPHDPPRGESNCPLCQVKWPCDERKRQRQVWKEIQGVVQDAGYRVRVNLSGTPDREWVTYEDPIGWRLRISYGEKGIRAQVSDSNGNIVAETGEADAYWIERELP